VSTTKAMTLRLPAELAAELEAVAAVDQQPIAEVVRVAIANFIRKRKADPVFQADVAACITRLRRLLSAGAAGDWPEQHPTTLIPPAHRGTIPLEKEHQ
jgi:predicted DNA-binding protein